MTRISGRQILDNSIALIKLIASGTRDATTFLRWDGVFAVPPTGWTPWGSNTQVQYNNNGSLDWAANVTINDGDLTLLEEPAPTIPTDWTVKIFGKKIWARMMPAFIDSTWLDTCIQPSFARNKIWMVLWIWNNTNLSVIWLWISATGNATAATTDVTNIYTMIRKVEYLITTPATNAVVSFRLAAAQFAIWHATNPILWWFHMVFRWWPATWVATGTNRAFVWMRNSTAAATDVEPSSITNMIWMWWDSADTNIQFMHRWTGTITKIDLGASFPVPTTNRTNAYEIALFSPPGTTQKVFYEITNLWTGAVASGIITTNLPATNILLAPYSYMSVWGTSSVIGIAIMSLYIETDY